MEKDINKFFEKELGKVQTQNIQIIGKGIGYRIRKKDRAKVTVKFDAVTFIKMKAIAYRDPNFTFQDILDKACEDWVRRYQVKEGSVDIPTGMEDIQNLKERAYMAKQLDNVMKTSKTAWKRGPGRPKKS